MALTKRERYISIITVVAIVILISDKLLITPLIQIRQRLNLELYETQTLFEQADLMVARKGAIENQWRHLFDIGLDYDVEKIEGSVFRYVKDSSQKRGVALSSIQPDIVSSDDGLGHIEFTLSAFGTMKAVSQFIWDMETSQLPLRIINFQIGSGNKSASVINLQMKLSAIYLIDNKNRKDD